ncbi:MAG: PEP-CTERM sorting domain-containing protein [Massilia sp.]
MKNHIATAVALLLIGAAGAHATPLPLQGATITATYNGKADGMLGLDHWFAQEAGSNTSTLDPTGTGVEFLTSDYLFGIDFAASGALTVIANGAIPTGAYSMRFDFGSSLANPISAFTLAGASGATGAPGLSIVDAHTIALDLGAVGWAEFGSLTAQVDTSAPVPEPASVAIVLAGLAGIGFARRSRNPHA